MLEIVVGGILLVLGMLLIMGYGLSVKSPKVKEEEFLDYCQDVFIIVLCFYVILVVIFYV